MQNQYSGKFIFLFRNVIHFLLFLFCVQEIAANSSEIDGILSSINPLYPDSVIILEHSGSTSSIIYMTDKSEDARALISLFRLIVPKQRIELLSGMPSVDFSINCYYKGDFLYQIGFFVDDNLIQLSNRRELLRNDNADALMIWLKNNNVQKPLNSFDINKEKVEQCQLNWLKWKREMPACLKYVWSEKFINGDLHSWNPNEYLPDMQKCGSTDDQILELFRWYGSGEGLWSGYVAYEMIPQRMLDSYPLDRVIFLGFNKKLSIAQKYGFARYISVLLMPKKKDWLNCDYYYKIMDIFAYIETSTQSENILDIVRNRKNKLNILCRDN